MIKVVIVEDEELLRKGLIYTFDWQSLDCLVVGEAENGVEGKRVIEAMDPDLVVTDIKMPNMDGLAMLQAIENRNFETIIATGFAEFEYAKKAIELNVSHFVLKPIEDDKLKEIILQVKDAIYLKRQVKNLIKVHRPLDSTDLFQGKLLDINHNSSKIVRKIIEYIHENYQSRLSLQDVASGLDMSAGYVSRVFKEVTSFNVNDYINRYRISKSLELLKQDKYKLYEIAEMVGYREYKYFHHVFTQYMKCSPKEFVVTFEQANRKD